MAQSKMIKTFEDVEEKLRKRNDEEFKEYENLFTVNDCLMPFYIRGYESKYYSDEKEIAFYQYVRKQQDLDRMIGLFSLLNNFEFLIRSLSFMGKRYPNFQVVYVQKINDEKLYYFVLPFPFFTSDCIGKRVCATYAKSVHDENLEEIKLGNAQELIQIYTHTYTVGFVKPKPNITLFGEIYMHGKHNIMIDVKTIRKMFKDFAMTSSPHSLVDVEKYYNNKSEVFDTDSDSDSDIATARKAGRKRKLSSTSSSSPIVENCLIGDPYNITLEVMSTTDEEDN